MAWPSSSRPASRPPCSAKRTSVSRQACATPCSRCKQPGDNEIEREALAANALATRYAVCCHELQSMSGCSATKVRAIGVHGQTVRHRPEKGYTRQINNPALLAEMTQHRRDRRLPQPRRRRRRSGRAARAGLPRNGVRREGRDARRLQSRRHQQYHDAVGERHGARLRLRSGERTARRVGAPSSGKALRRGRTIRGTGTGASTAAERAARRTVFRAAAAEKHRARPVQSRSGSMRSWRAFPACHPPTCRRPWSH